MLDLARFGRFLACALVALLPSTVLSQSSSSAPTPSPSADPYAVARRLTLDGKYAEAADALAKLAAVNPYDGWIWGNWGYCVHALKRYDEAITLFTKAIELDADPAGYIYNIGCAHSLMGHKDEAFAWLEKALDARFVNQETLENDTDLDPLRDDPRFARLTGITRMLKAPLVHSRDEGWRWDLDFYARRMKQMHWDLYGKVSEKEFHGELDRLVQDVSGLTDEQARLRLRKITALVGDGHTSCALAAEGATTIKRFPLQLYSFKEGLYVIGASSEHKSLIGSKVLKIGALDASAALQAARAYASVDNDMGYLSGPPDLLMNPFLLQAIGAASDENGADFTVASESSAAKPVHVAPVDASAKRQGGPFRSELVYAHQSSKTPLPFYLRDTKRNLRMEHDPDHKLVYFGFSAIADEPDVTLADFCKHLFEFIETNNVEHLVIDMRYNGGGNTGLIRPLIDGLTTAKSINRTGHLWVIIGRRTFSAAQNTVNLISAFEHPIFVGEPTGSRPRFIGESTWFVLPHSRTRVYCSSRYWQVLDSTDNRPWIPPQIVAEPTFADFAALRDPAMEAIYAVIGATKGSESQVDTARR